MTAAKRKSSRPAKRPCGTPRCGVLVSLCPAAVPGGPDTGHASRAVMSCAQHPGDPCRHAVGGTPPQDGTCTAPIPIACASGAQAGASSPRPRRGSTVSIPHAGSTYSSLWQALSGTSHRQTSVTPTCHAIVRSTTAEGVTHRCGLQPHSFGKASQDRSASP